jgi:hypothetical protein
MPRGEVPLVGWQATGAGLGGRGSSWAGGLGVAGGSPLLPSLEGVNGQLPDAAFSG